MGKNRARRVEGDHRSGPLLPERRKDAPPHARSRFDQFHLDISATYSGPLPPPGWLQGYERVLAGAADRILALTEREATGRQRVVETAAKNRRVDSRRGPLFAFVLAVLFGLGGFWLIAHDKSASGLALIAVDLVGLVSVFVRFRPARPESRVAPGGPGGR